MDRRQFLLAGAAAALTVAGPGLGRALAGGTPVALVTADTEAHVAVVDIGSGAIVRRLPTAAIPRSIELCGSTAVVAHSELGRVTLIDVPGLGRRPLEGRVGEPRYAAAHPDGRHAYLSDSALDAVIVIDVLRGRVVRRIAVGGPARHIGIDRRGRRLWAALGSTAAALAVLDIRDPVHPRRLGTVRPPFLAHDVAFAPDGRVWVTSGDRGTVAIYEPGSARLIGRVAADAPPQHLAFGDRVAYVTSGDDGTLRAHRLDGRPLRTTAIPVGSFNVARGGGLLVTPSLTQGTLCLLDRHARRGRTVRVAGAAHDACIAIVP